MFYRWAARGTGAVIIFPPRCPSDCAILWKMPRHAHNTAFDGSESSIIRILARQSETCAAGEVSQVKLPNLMVTFG